MSVEVVCGNCQGRLIVETPGIVVACPHCNTHLSVPAETAPPATEEAATATAPVPVEQPAVNPPAATPEIPVTPAPEQPIAEAPVEPAPVLEQPIDPANQIPDFSAAEPAAEISAEELSADPQAAAETDAPAQWSQPADDQTIMENFNESGKAASTPEWSAPTAEGDATIADAGAAVPSMEDAETIISPPSDTPFAEEFGNVGEPAAVGDDQTTAWAPPGDDESPELTSAFDPEVPDPTLDLSDPLDEDIPEFGDEPAVEQTEAWVGDPLPEAEEQVAATVPGFGGGAVQPTQPAAWNNSPDAPTMAMDPQYHQQFAPQPAAAAQMPVGAAPVAGGAVPVTAAPTAQTKKKSFLPLLVLILISYASALTLAFIFLIIKTSNPKPHDLESLPDLKPPMRKKSIALKLVPESADMAPGHSLYLGSEQRFGSLKVTPIKVTKSPLEFEYFDRDPSKKKAPTKQVLKLWLKFENVSEDQVFAPLDRKLMFTRAASKQGSEFDRANNFVCRRSQKKKDGKRLLVYEISEDSPWDFRGQQSGKELAPGESYETYIPTIEEGLEELEGNLVWRVQFRKGYNPESFRGVTTLIEVDFHSDEIVKGS